jgi:hypothetical protein
LYPNIALSGLAGSGKDTVAAHLVAHYGFTRLALADPLKEMALRIDPIIAAVAGEPLRLVYLVDRYGWDDVKRSFPESRRFLQQLGGAVREIDDEFWLDTLFGEISRTAGPIVVTDVRYMNELVQLRRNGFVPVRITRPDVATMDHASETELASVTFTERLYNSGSIRQLEQRVDVLMSSLI